MVGRCISRAARGAGYVLKDAEAADKVRRRGRMSYMIFFVFMLPILVQLIQLNTPSDIPVLLVAGVSAGLAFNILLRWHARGLPRSNVRLTLRDASARQVKSLGRGWLIAMIILSLSLIGLGAMVLALDAAELNWLGWTLIAMFTACLVCFILQLRAHARMAANNDL